MDRAIIHLNVADFAVAVERAIDRRLDGRPMVIALQGAARAAVTRRSATLIRSSDCWSCARAAARSARRASVSGAARACSSTAAASSREGRRVAVPDITVSRC